jgi:hypothetical protein
LPRSAHRLTWSPLSLAVVLQGCGNENHPPVTFTLQGFGTLGGAESYACDTNASGHAAGYSMTKGDTEVHSINWDCKALADLGIVAGAPACIFGIDDAGQVSGSAKFDDDRYPDPALSSAPMAFITLVSICRVGLPSG